MTILDILKSIKLSYETANDNGLKPKNVFAMNRDLISGMYINGEIDENGERILNNWNTNLLFVHNR